MVSRIAKCDGLNPHSIPKLGSVQTAGHGAVLQLITWTTGGRHAPISRSPPPTSQSRDTATHGEEATMCPTSLWHIRQVGTERERVHLPRPHHSWNACLSLGDQQGVCGWVRKQTGWPAFITHCWWCCCYTYSYSNTKMCLSLANIF